MKPFMILGALVGFFIGASFGIAGITSWPTALWHASAAALGGAVLTRWWANIWVQGLRESLSQRRGSRSLVEAHAKPIAKP